MNPKYANSVAILCVVLCAIIIGSAIIVEVLAPEPEPGSRQPAASKKKEEKSKADKDRPEDVSDSRDKEEVAVKTSRRERDSSTSAPKKPKRIEPTEKPKKQPTKVVSKDGWIPSSATEVARVSSYPTQAKSGPHCRDERTPIRVGKEFGSVFDQIMRDQIKISDEEEKELGAKILAEIEAGRVPQFKGKWDLASDRKKYGGYVQALVDKLARKQSRKLRYRTYMVRDSAFNAFAMPGGIIGVHTGLFDGPDAVKSEAELVAILAHEIAHIEKRHVSAEYAVIKRTLGEQVPIATIITRLLASPISTERELEADRRGVDLGIAIQYDPMAATHLWKRIGKRHPTGREGLLATHPSSARRCYRILGRVAARKRDDRFEHGVYYIGQSNLTSLTPGFRDPH